MKTNSCAIVGLIVTFAAIPASVIAAERVLTVVQDQAPVYAEPDSSSEMIMRLKKGQRFKSDGEVEKGYYHLVTKSGRDAWIHKKTVQGPKLDGVEDLIAADGDTESPPRQTASRDFRRFTVDLGGASHISQDQASYEINLGVNYYFFEWFYWRNSPFYRFQTGADSFYGLDSSLDLQYSLHLIPGITPHAGVGAGYRVTSSGPDAPFVEGSAGLDLGGLNVSAGTKVILNSVTSAQAKNEVLFSLSFSGGISF